jgi:hypothetical protein
MGLYRKDDLPRRWFASVLTDIQFWVPFAVLLGDCCF